MRSRISGVSSFSSLFFCSSLSHTLPDCIAFSHVFKAFHRSFGNTTSGSFFSRLEDAFASTIESLSNVANSQSGTKLNLLPTMSGIKIICRGISNVPSVTFNTNVNNLNTLKSNTLDLPLSAFTIPRAAFPVNRRTLFAADLAASPVRLAARAPGTRRLTSLPVLPPGGAVPALGSTLGVGVTPPSTKYSLNKSSSSSSVSSVHLGSRIGDTVAAFTLRPECSLATGDPSLFDRGACA